MAEKRMFSMHIIDSDAFLEMSIHAQLLYFHLGMRADDDGFINNPSKIMRIIGTNQDDIVLLKKAMDLLIEKKFIIMFDSGVVVIKHWLVNNYLRTDRKKSTTQTAEFNQLKLKNNKSYTLINNAGITDVRQMSGNCQVSIDKIRLDKYSIDTIDHQDDRVIAFDSKENTKSKTELINEFELLWKLYPRKIGKEKSLKKYLEYSKNTDDLFQKVKVGINNYLEYIKTNSIENSYIKHGTTYFNNKSWEDEYPTGKTKSYNTTKVKTEIKKAEWYDRYEDELQNAKTVKKELTDEEKLLINKEAKELFK